MSNDKAICYMKQGMLLSFVFCALTLISCQSQKEEMTILDEITSI